MAPPSSAPEEIFNEDGKCVCASDISGVAKVTVSV